MPDIYIEAEGHWQGDAERYCGRLVVEVNDQEHAADLAILFRRLREGGSGTLRELVEMADPRETNQTVTL